MDTYICGARLILYLVFKPLVSLPVAFFFLIPVTSLAGGYQDLASSVDGVRSWKGRTNDGKRTAEPRTIPYNKTGRVIRMTRPVC